jgi:hypothetical protein
VKQNNFIPSSNLSQFLLKKGSNGSLHTFENEYSYKINLNNLNQAPAPSTKPKKANLNKKNNLFKEVIVEDEAEDIRGSQMGSNPEQQQQMQQQNQLFPNNQQVLKKSQGGANLDQFRNESNSPTPNRNTNKLLMSGGMKMSQQ